MSCDVLLLCAGRSARMWPLGDKLFFEYLGKTVIEHQISWILEEIPSALIHIITNAENEVALKQLLQEKFSAVFEHFIFSRQENLESGMLGGILAAQKKIDWEKGLLIMSPNDIVEKHLLANLLQTAEKSKSQLFLCGKEVEKYFPGGYLIIDSEKHVHGIQEKPGAGNETSDFVNLVFHLFQNPRQLFAALEASPWEKNGDHYGYETCLQALFDDGVVAEVVPYQGFWQALKYPWHHLLVMAHFLEGIPVQKIHPQAQVSPKATISGSVIIEDGVRIFDFAVIQGPAFIGKNTIIGNHVLVRGSHIGSNCVIGHGTEVARSYLRQEIWLHQNYVGDSILSENVSFGAGARTANFRLDEGEVFVSIQEEKIPTGLTKLGLICGPDVRSGINTSFFPGIKIGRNSLLGGGIVVNMDIPENTFVFGKGELEQRPNKFPVQKRPFSS